MTGWLAKDGTFYACEPNEHFELICALGFKDEIQAEQVGMCKIYRIPNLEYIGLYGLPDDIKYSSELYCDLAPGMHSLTEAQLAYLLEHHIITNQQYIENL